MAWSIQLSYSSSTPRSFKKQGLRHEKRSECLKSVQETLREDAGALGQDLRGTPVVHVRAGRLLEVPRRPICGDQTHFAPCSDANLEEAPARRLSFIAQHPPKDVKE